MGLFYFRAVKEETEHNTTPSLSIKSWAEDDRPREKMLQKGRKSLSDAELIAILIGSGNRNDSAVELSRRILSSVHHDLDDLGTLSINQLTKFKGIGEAKAITIAAALEIGRRRKFTESKPQSSITSSKDAFEMLYPELSDLPHEEFYMILLRRNNSVIDLFKVSQGGVSGTVVDAKMVFSEALVKNASSIILAHNHPSGNLKPSRADLNLTNQLVQAGKVLDINVLDHLIIGGKSYYSFADEGQMNS